jgi:hypothetical protein
MGMKARASQRQRAARVGGGGVCESARQARVPASDPHPSCRRSGRRVCGRGARESARGRLAVVGGGACRRVEETAAAVVALVATSAATNRLQ